MVKEKTLLSQANPQRGKWLKKTGWALVLIFAIVIFVVVPKLIPPDGNLYLAILIGSNLLYCFFVFFKEILKLKKQKSEFSESVTKKSSLAFQVVLSGIYPIGILIALFSVGRFLPENSVNYVVTVIVLLVVFAIIGLLKSIVWFKNEKPGTDEKFDAGLNILLNVSLSISIAIEVWDIVDIAKFAQTGLLFWL